MTTDGCPAGTGRSAITGSGTCAGTGSAGRTGGCCDQDATNPTCIAPGGTCAMLGSEPQVCSGANGFCEECGTVDAPCCPGQLCTETDTVCTTVAVNDARKSAMAMRVIAACGGSVRGKTIAVLGLTFKRNTDDERDSLSPKLIRLLERELADVAVCDPHASTPTQPLQEGWHQARMGDGWEWGSIPFW